MFIRIHAMIIDNKGALLAVSRTPSLGVIWSGPAHAFPPLLLATETLHVYFNCFS